MQSNNQILNLTKIKDARGNLTFLQFPDHIPFEIKRVFWTYDVPGGEIRGGHAYYAQQELIIALSGSFDVIITNLDGSIELIQLNRAYFGLFLPPNTWRHIENFSTNALALHLSDHIYDPADYIWDFDILRMQEK
jgi:hypothetical protein